MRFSVTLSAFYHRGMEMEKFLDERTPFRGGDLVDRSLPFRYVGANKSLGYEQADYKLM